MQKIHTVAIVGAGICGLSLGSLLTKSGQSCVLIEKSKSVGGRLATRRNGEAVFDHGAQFYKNSNERSIFWHQEMKNTQTSQLWFTDEKKIEYHCGSNGMTQIAKKIKESCESVVFNERAIRLFKSDGFINLECESGSCFKAHKVVLTCPLPQSLEILKSSGLDYPPELDQITYAKALVGLFQTINGFSDTEKSFTYGKNSIFSISNNRFKKISPVPSFTVVMNPDFSEKNFNLSDDEIINLIESEFLKETGLKTEIIFRQLKKWRYSHPNSIYSNHFYQVGGQPEVFVGGDAFSGASIYGAVQSAEFIMDFLQQINQFK